MENKNETRYENLLFIMWGTALIATLGSLFFSEVLRYVPCKLCWYQRILMYPLVVIYGLALIKKDSNIALPGFVLSVIGLVIAVYHYALQKIPVLESVDTCGVIPCVYEYFNYFNFITIPFLSLLGFAIICTIHFIIILRNRR